MVNVPPYAVRVGEHLLPKPIGGHPALELCNTYAGWGEPAGADWLTDYRLLAAWAEFTGLVPAARDLPVRSRSAAAVLDEVRSFRVALYGLLVGGGSAGSAGAVSGVGSAGSAGAVGGAGASGSAERTGSAHGTAPAHGAGSAEGAAIPGGTDFAAVAARVDEANALRRLTPGPDGSAALALPPSRDVRLPLHAAALAAADLLARPERASVHACPGRGCGWLFLDPRGRRVWCIMAACGNRAKVRAHAARHR